MPRANHNRVFREGTINIQIINLDRSEHHAFQRACLEVGVSVTEAMRRLIHKVAEGDEALFARVVK